MLKNPNNKFYVFKPFFDWCDEITAADMAVIAVSMVGGGFLFLMFEYF